MEKNIYKSATSLMLMLGLTASMVAGPAKPGLRTVKLSDGREINVYIKGDERFHYYMSEDGYLLTRGSDDYFYYSDFDETNGILSPTEVRAFDIKERSEAESRFVSNRTKGVPDKLNAHTQYLAQRAMRIAKAGKSEDSENPHKLTDFPTIGSPRTLAILVEFKDKKFSIDNPEQTFKDFMMKKNFTNDNGATFSVHDYYSACSGELFDPQFDVFGPVTLPNNLAYYGGNDVYGNDDKPEEMVRDACMMLDDQINFAEYDCNGDGWVDNVYIFYAGYSEAEGASANAIWPHSWDIWLGAQVRLELDGVYVGRYGCSQELNIDNDKLVGIGVFCHEFGHVLGLPDVYSTSYNSESFTPGEYTLMDAGEYNDNSNTPPYLTAYERWCLGWHDPEIIDRAMNVTLPPMSEGAVKSYMIKTTDENEMYFLENRQQEGYDKFIPGHGMLVWHIDYDEDSWNNNSVNNIGSHQGIDLVEADAKQTPETRAGDPFPGTSNITSFTDNTYPSMRDWQGASLNLPITEITEKDGIIEFKVLGGVFELEAVVLEEMSDISATSIKLSWNQVQRANEYLLNFYTLENGNKHFIRQNFKMGNVYEYTVTSLQPETTYYATVSASDGIHISQESNVVSATTEEADFTLFMPAVTEATDVTGTSFTANWEALEGATDYIINVYDRNNAGETVQTIDFTNGISDFPEGWTTNCNSLIMTEGMFGAAAPSLRMGKTGSFISSPLYNGKILNLSFWYKGAYMGTDNIASVSISEDGQKWEVLDFLDIHSDTDKFAMYGKGQDIKIEEGTAQFRIYFEKPMDGENTSGFIYIDDIRVSIEGNDQPVPLPDFIERSVGNTLSCKVEGLSPGKEYYYIIQASDGKLKSLQSQKMYVRTATSIENTVDNELVIYSGDGGISIRSTAGRQVRICTPSGVVVYDREIDADTEFISLDKGIYIVSCGNKSVKAVVL